MAYLSSPFPSTAEAAYISRIETLEAIISDLRKANSDLASASIVPDHLVLAPKEPTTTMCIAALLLKDGKFNPAGIYKAMIDAAQGEEG